MMNDQTAGERARDIYLLRYLPARRYLSLYERQQMVVANFKETQVTRFI